MNVKFSRLVCGQKSFAAGPVQTRWHAPGCNIEKWDPATWPEEAKGDGTAAAPRGALAHWIKIKDGRIDNFQCVVPSTWNASPRDAKGQIGAYGAALLGTPMVNPEQPREILRTLHSFDPCLACAAHVMSPDGQELTSVKVR